MLWAGPSGAGPRARLRGRRQRERSRSPPAQRALSLASEGLFGVPRGRAPFCAAGARTLLQVTDSSTPSHPAPATRIACYGVRWRVEGWEGCEGGSRLSVRAPLPRAGWAPAGERKRSWGWRERTRGGSDTAARVRSGRLLSGSLLLVRSVKRGPGTPVPVTPGSHFFWLLSPGSG